MTPFLPFPAFVPQEPENGHVAYTDSVERLTAILPIQEERRLSKNLTCSVEGQLLQLNPSGSGRGLRGMRVQIHWHVDGRIEVRRQDVLLPYTVVTIQPKATAVVSGKNLNAKLDEMSHQRRGHKPAAGQNNLGRAGKGTSPVPKGCAASGKASLQASG